MKLLFIIGIVWLALSIITVLSIHLLHVLISNKAKDKYAP